MREVDAIIAASKTDQSTPDLAGDWAQDIASSQGCLTLTADKLRVIAPQKSVSDTEGEQEVTARVANSVIVREVPVGIRVLILDDTIRSGGTIRELGRALREAGAGEVYALSVTKDARFTLGGVNLAKERWE